MYIPPPRPFMDEVFSEERQLIKWVGIFQVGIFQGGSLMGRNFPSGNFPGGIFLEPATQGKLFYSIQYKNGYLAASDLYHMFTQSSDLFHMFTQSADLFHMVTQVLYIPLSRIKENRCLKNVIYQIVKMNGCSFQQALRQTLGWFLSEHWKTLFLSGFILSQPKEHRFF